MHALMRVQSFHLEHYAGTVYAVVLCLSVCLCHKLVFCFEMAEQIELFFLLKRLPSTCPTLCFKEIRAILKIGIPVLPLELCLKLWT